MDYLKSHVKSKLICINTVVQCSLKEPWSREYFDRLKAAHQCHYEQFGEVSGTFSVDGEEKNLKVLEIYNTFLCSLKTNDNIN